MSPSLMALDEFTDIKKHRFEEQQGVSKSELSEDGFLNVSIAAKV